MINKPQADEYNPFFNTYISKVPDGNVLKALESQKESTYNLLSALGDDKANYAYAQGKWTTKQVLGHMIDAERIFAYRLLCFSRKYEELPGFDENAYVDNANFNDRTIQDLASEFRAVREANIYMIKALTDEQLVQKGLSNGNIISVRALIYILAGHELHHLIIIKEKYLI